jgi:uncharacterized phiE125 gp8 family phage protein
MNQRAIKIITAPVLEPITLTEAKAQCRVDISDDDALITGYIAAARDYCEKIDWRAYLTQTIELWLEEWPCGDEISLPRPPLQSVTKIEYYGVDDTKYTLETSVYGVDANSTPGRVHLKYNQVWPSTQLRDYSAICVTYLAGWTAAANVPQTIKQAVLLLVGHWYENREATTVGAVSRPIEFAVESLLGLNRAMRF